MSNLSIWRDHWWLILSGQLSGLHIDPTNFEGLLLKKDTPNGTWLWNWLGRVFEQHSNTARRTATIRVLEPGYGSGGCCTLMLEVQVRRRNFVPSSLCYGKRCADEDVDQTRQFATFPVPFGGVPTLATASEASVATSEAPGSASEAPGPSSEAPGPSSEAPGPSSEAPTLTAGPSASGANKGP